MLIEDFSKIEELVEKQIQPAQGKKEGNILVVGGGSGSGKNWVVDNLTDIPNRYKILNPDDIIDMASKMEPEKLTKAFHQFIDDHVEDEGIFYGLHDTLDDAGIANFARSRNEAMSKIMYKFIHDMDYKGKSFNNLLKSILTSATNPNIAFNGTMRYIPTIIKDIEILKEYGYDVDGKVDCLFVLAPQRQSYRDAAKRVKNLRAVDRQFLHDSRESFHKNMFKVLYGNSPLTKYIRNVYVVFNKHDDTTYYDETNVVKDFKYMKIKPLEMDKIEKLKTLFTDYE